MHRFFLPPELCRADVLSLTGREAHHAVQVLRLRTGERVTMLDGAGTELLCDVTSQKRDALELRVQERKTADPLPCAITLLQAVPKGKTIEGIIQKATELGAARIVPILSARVIMQLDHDGAKSKAEKWQQIAIEAIKQCGSPWLPKVEAPIAPEEFLARHESFELTLIGCLESGSRHPREWFQKFVHEQKRLPKSVCIWIGPEGDFSAEEYKLIKGTGALPMTLGRLVLRVETAATYALSVVNYELDAGPAYG